jgi:hypothetical protein
VSYGNTTALGSLEFSSVVETNHSITLNGLSDNATYYYNVTSCDASGNCNTSGPFEFATLEIVPPSIGINWSEWDPGQTTNFSAYNASALSNISNVTLSNAYGGIAFLEPLNISQDINVTGNVVVTGLSIFVNSTALPQFNRSAALVFRNVSLSRPIAKKDGSDCGDACQNATFNASDGTFLVNVTGFSTYSLVEQCSDGVQNYGETGVDCGGYCAACYSPPSGGSPSGSGFMPQAGNATNATQSRPPAPANTTQPAAGQTQNGSENDVIEDGGSQKGDRENKGSSVTKSYLGSIDPGFIMLIIIIAILSVIVAAMIIQAAKKWKARRRLFGKNMPLPRIRPPYEFKPSSLCSLASA